MKRHIFTAYDMINVTRLSVMRRLMEKGEYVLMDSDVG